MVILFLRIRRPPESTQSRSSAASDVYKRQALKDADAVILAVPHKEYLDLDPEKIVKTIGKPAAIIDCFGILTDDRIRKYFKLGCEVKGLGRGHIQRIKEEIRKK